MHFPPIFDMMVGFKNVFILYCLEYVEGSGIRGFKLSTPDLSSLKVNNLYIHL